MSVPSPHRSNNRSSTTAPPRSAPSCVAITVKMGPDATGSACTSQTRADVGPLRARDREEREREDLGQRRATRAPDLRRERHGEESAREEEAGGSRVGVARQRDDAELRGEGVREHRREREEGDCGDGHQRARDPSTALPEPRPHREEREPDAQNGTERHGDSRESAGRSERLPDATQRGHAGASQRVAEVERREAVEKADVLAREGLVEVEVCAEAGELGGAGLVAEDERGGIAGDEAEREEDERGEDEEDDEGLQEPEPRNTERAHRGRLGGSARGAGVVRVGRSVRPVRVRGEGVLARVLRRVASAASSVASIFASPFASTAPSRAFASAFASVFAAASTPASTAASRGEPRVERGARGLADGRDGVGCAGVRVADRARTAVDEAEDRHADCDVLDRIEDLRVPGRPRRVPAEVAGAAVGVGAARVAALGDREARRAADGVGTTGDVGGNRMQNALSGQSEPRELPVQLRTVQKPPGSDVSHTRVPSLAQSVERAQLSPMLGVQPASQADAASRDATTAEA